MTQDVSSSHWASPGGMTVQSVFFAPLQASESAGPTFSKQAWSLGSRSFGRVTDSKSPNTASWQLSSNGMHSERSESHCVRSDWVHGASLSAHVPVAQRPVVSSKTPPLLKQSTSAMQPPTVQPVGLLVGSASHIKLQLSNASSTETPSQSALPLVTMQLSAAAVSWRASCRSG